MIVIEIFHNNKNVKVDIKSNYYDDGGYRYAKTLALGFKWFKNKYLFSKIYTDNEYTQDRFLSDIEEIKKLYTGRTIVKRYKLLEETVTG